MFRPVTSQSNVVMNFALQMQVSSNAGIFCWYLGEAEMSKILVRHISVHLQSCAYIKYWWFHGYQYCGR